MNNETTAQPNAETETTPNTETKTTDKFKGFNALEVLTDISNRNETDETDEKYFNYIMQEIFKVNVKCVCGIVYPTMQSIQQGCKDSLKVIESLGVTA